MNKTPKHNIREKTVKSEVIFAAILNFDLLYILGDKTVVGDRGSVLSGGQRARVNLARAVYRNSQIILLDDPLSAVDSHVSKYLFDECINGYLAKQKITRILVTHQVHLLKEVDWIVVMEGGRILKQGTYKDIMQSDLDLNSLVGSPVEGSEEDAYSEPEEEDIPFIDGAESRLIKRSDSKVKRATSMSIQSLYSTVSNEDNKRQVAEDQAGSSIPLSVWLDYFLSGAGICFILLTFLVLICSQLVVSGSDYFVTFWTNQEYLRTLNESTVFTTNEGEVLMIVHPLECHYLNYHFFPGIYYYGSLILLVIFVTLLRCALFFSICMHASKVLHSRMFTSLLNAPMKFFNQNPTGRILNRFSKDMGAIDELLPKAMMESIQVLY